jgi:hypothetical protein
VLSREENGKRLWLLFRRLEMRTAGREEGLPDPCVGLDAWESRSRLQLLDQEVVRVEGMRQTDGEGATVQKSAEQDS